MNEQLAAMLELAALRDTFVIRLFVVAAVVLISTELLRRAPISHRTLRVLLMVQRAAFLLAWITVLVVLGVYA
jgi:hypothetical protein